MSYVIYNKETTRLFSVPARSAHMWKDTFGSKGAATRTFNKAVREEKINADEYAIAESSEFYNSIEKTHMVRNLMTGDLVEERVNTPGCCSVASERYWCM